MNVRCDCDTTVRSFCTLGDEQVLSFRDVIIDIVASFVTHRSIDIFDLVFFSPARRWPVAKCYRKNLASRLHFHFLFNSFYHLVFVVTSEISSKRKEGSIDFLAVRAHSGGRRNVDRSRETSRPGSSASQTRHSLKSVTSPTHTAATPLFNILYVQPLKQAVHMLITAVDILTCQLAKTFVYAYSVQHKQTNKMAFLRSSNISQLRDKTWLHFASHWKSTGCVCVDDVVDINECEDRIATKRKCCQANARTRMRDVIYISCCCCCCGTAVQVPQIYPASPIASHIWRGTDAVTSRHVTFDRRWGGLNCAWCLLTPSLLGNGRSQQITHFLSLFHSRLLASARVAVKVVVCTSVAQLSFLQFSFLFRHKMAPLVTTFSICYCQTKKSSFLLGT